MKTIFSALVTFPYTLLCIVILGSIAQAAPIPKHDFGIARPMSTFLRTETPYFLPRTVKDNQILLNRRSGTLLDPVTIESTPEAPDTLSTDAIAERIRHKPIDFLRSLVKKLQSSKGWQWVERQGSKISQLLNKIWDRFTRFASPKLRGIPNAESTTVTDDSPQAETPLVLLEPRPMEDTEEIVNLVPTVQGAGPNSVPIEVHNGHDSDPSWEHKGKWSDVEGGEIPAYPAVDPNTQQMAISTPPGDSEQGSAGYIDRWNAAVFQSLGAKRPSVDTESDTRAATLASSATDPGTDSETQPKSVELASKPNNVATEPKTVAEPKTVPEPKFTAAQPKPSPDEPKPNTHEPKIIAGPKPVTATQVVTTDSQPDTDVNLASRPRPKGAVASTLPLLPQPVTENEPLSDDKALSESSGKGGQGHEAVEDKSPVMSALPPKPPRPRTRPGWITPQEKNRGLDDWPGKHPCVVCKDGDPGPDPPLYRDDPFVPRTPRDEQTWWEFLTTFGQGYKFIGPLPYDPKEHYYGAYKINVPNPWKNPKTYVPTPRKPGEPVPEYEDYNPYDPKPLHPSKVQTWQQIQEQAREEARTGKYKHPRPDNFYTSGDRNKHGLKDWNGNLVKLPVRGDWELIPPKDILGLTKLVDIGQYRLACQKLADEQHIMAGLRPPEKTAVDLLIRSICL